MPTDKQIEKLLSTIGSSKTQKILIDEHKLEPSEAKYRILKLNMLSPLPTSHERFR